MNTNCCKVFIRNRLQIASTYSEDEFDISFNSNDAFAHIADGRHCAEIMICEPQTANEPWNIIYFLYGCHETINAALDEALDEIAAMIKAEQICERCS